MLFNQIKHFTKQEISCLYCILWYETSNKWPEGFPVKNILKAHNSICPVMIKRLNMLVSTDETHMWITKKIKCTLFWLKILKIQEDSSSNITLIKTCYKLTAGWNT